MLRSEVYKAAFSINRYLASSWLGQTRFWLGLKKFAKNILKWWSSSGGLILVRVNGQLMYVRANTGDTDHYLMRPFEPFTAKLFSEAVKPGAVVVDVGAQFGYFSLLAASKCGPSGIVYAYEPVPVNFDVLKKNIQLN